MKLSKLFLVVLSCYAVPALAQSACVDNGGGVYTASGASGRNVQCLVNLPAGNYEVILSGGGGGGGGGSAAEGGGGGGAGALPVRKVMQLAGTYRLTIGKGGQGGTGCLSAKNGGFGGDGHPTSMANASNGQVIAGFPGAERYAARTPEGFSTVASARDVSLQPNPADDGSGARGIGAQSDGGSGGLGNERRPTDGGLLKVGSWPGQPGRGATQAIAGGGGGGASFGNGGSGGSNQVAMAGELGAGGGGGNGGQGTCAAGAAGGDGFVKIALLEPARAAAPAPAPAPVMRESAPAPAAIAPAPVEQSNTRRSRRDRN